MRDEKRETIGGTVAEIVKRVRRECNSYPLPNAAGEKLQLVREMNDAHNREIAAKDAEIEKLKFDIMHLKSVQRTSGEVIIEQTNKVEAKDAQIAELEHNLAKQNEINHELVEENARLNNELRIDKKAKYEYAIQVKSSRTWDVVLSGIYSLDDAMNTMSFLNLKKLGQERRTVRRTVGEWEVVE